MVGYLVVCQPFLGMSNERMSLKSSAERMQVGSSNDPHDTRFNDSFSAFALIKKSSSFLRELLCDNLRTESDILVISHSHRDCFSLQILPQLLGSSWSVGHS